MTENPLYTLGVQLVSQRIPGVRKGSNEPAYQHSLRVAERLERHGYSPDVVLAGLLHDIVEDGETSLTALRDMGFSERTLEIVDLSSHDMSLSVHTGLQKDQRWAGMVARLEQAHDADAWAVKVCDLIDNLAGSVTLLPDRQAVFFALKGPTYLALSRSILGQTALWSELLEAFTAPGLARFRALLEG
jgi:(p)ppGpp synthase/HD superfamily hydrolase